MRLFTVRFKAMYPVPCGLIIKAETDERALEIARETIKHTQVDEEDVTEIPMTEGVAFYESGDY